MQRKPLGLSVKALVHDGRGSYLLIRRSLESTFWPGKWDLPGGKVDAGESFDVALTREVREETGLALQFEGVVGAVEFDLPHCLVAVLVIKAVASDAEVQLSSEHEGCEWVRRRDLAECEFGNALNNLVSEFADEGI